jgi:transcriptional regulator with XRE-family HTH domain
MTRSLTDTVAAEVRAELGRQHKTGAWLARQLGVSEAWVSRRLGEKDPQPMNVRDLERIASALKVDVQALMPVAA